MNKQRKWQVGEIPVGNDLHTTQIAVMEGATPIALMFGPDMEANAHFIAAAPWMHEQLANAKDRIEVYLMGGCKQLDLLRLAIEEINAALAKADRK